MEENPTLKMTDFDCLVTNESLQILKAMLPYFPANGRHFLSVYTKIMEMQNTMRVFSQPNGGLSICSNEERENLDFATLIGQIKEYCSPATRAKMDDWMQYLALFEMIQLMQEEGG